MRRVLLTFAVLAAVAAVALGVAAWQARSVLNEPMPLGGPQTITIAPGSSLGSVAADMQARGFIPRARWLTLYARLTEQATAIKAGEYSLEPPLSAVEALQKFVAGEVVLHSVTFVEGWTLRQALETLQAHPAIVAAHDTEPLPDSIDTTHSNPEGLLFPSTYHFSRGTPAVEIVQSAHRLLQQELDRSWEERQPDLPLDTPYEVLILASIIEKETARDDERRRIAGVFVRRLKKKMRLQTDPTVIYGLGQNYDGNIRRRDLSRDTPYNTYTRSGLPPTPIALAGSASIRAAVNPEPGNALYFVATGAADGSHYFSATHEEHEAAVARYLAALRSKRTNDN